MLLLSCNHNPSRDLESSEPRLKSRNIFYGFKFTTESDKEDPGSLN